MPANRNLIFPTRRQPFQSLLLYPLIEAEPGHLVHSKKFLANFEPPFHYLQKYPMHESKRFLAKEAVQMHRYLNVCQQEFCEDFEVSFPECKPFHYQ